MFFCACVRAFFCFLDDKRVKVFFTLHDVNFIYTRVDRFVAPILGVVMPQRQLVVSEQACKHTSEVSYQSVHTVS